MNRVKLCVIFLAVLVLSVQANVQLIHAQDSSWRQEINRWVRDMVVFRGFGERGYKIDSGGPFTGQVPGLTLMQSQIVGLSLSASARYIVLAKCDDNCSRLDLALFDPTGQKVGEAFGMNGITVLEYAPRYPGQYTLRGTVERCTRQGIPCNWGGSVLEGPR